MVRCSRTRNFLREVAKSPFIEKISFILPFFVISVDIIILEHAIRIQETYIIIFTSSLFILSLTEIIAVAHELHRNYQNSTFKKVLKCKIDDFIGVEKQYNIKKIVEDFISINPEYYTNRTDVYQITCQILENRGENSLEKIVDENFKS